MVRSCPSPRPRRDWDRAHFLQDSSARSLPGACLPAAAGSPTDQGRSFEKRGYKLAALKMAHPSVSLLEQHYDDLKTKGFFPGLIKYMASGSSSSSKISRSPVVRTRDLHGLGGQGRRQDWTSHPRCDQPPRLGAGNDPW